MRHDEIPPRALPRELASALDRVGEVFRQLEDVEWWLRYTVISDKRDSLSATRGRLLEEYEAALQALTRAKRRDPWSRRQHKYIPGGHSRLSAAMR